MKTKIALSLALCASLIAAEEPKKEEPKKEAKSLEEAFKLAEVKGQIRAVYQSNSKLEGESTADGLIGGKLGIETAPLYGASFGATFYTSNALVNKKEFKDADYYNVNNKDYTLLGEAFLKYSFDGGEVKVGRMELDTPFANSDDIRMIPNLFTAAIAQYSPIDKLNITAGVVTQMAGWENGGDHARFIKMGETISSAVADGGVWDAFFANNSSAMESKLYMAGVSCELDALSLQGWYGRQSEIMDTYYLEASAKLFDSEAFGASLKAQYMNEKSIGALKSYSASFGNEVAKIDGSIYGAALELTSKAVGLSGILAYNKSGKKEGAHSNGGTASFFGGGKDPLFTSMDVETANGEGDIKAYKGELSFDFEKAGVEGLSATFAHAYFDKKASGLYAKESDLTLAYGVKNLSVEAMLSNIKTKDASDNNRLRVFVKYDF